MYVCVCVRARARVTDHLDFSFAPLSLTDFVNKCLSSCSSRSEVVITSTGI